jgi:ubiquitin-conjugating enzyme E2 J2
MAGVQTLSKLTIKRLESEIKMIQKDPMEFIDTYHDEKDILTWYFMIRGPDKTDYEGGFYIGKIMLSPDYPASPPDYNMLTPSGRFEINRKICLTNSGFHRDQWSAIWNIKTLLEAFLSIMASDDTEGLAHIKDTKSNRKKMALDSLDYNLKHNKKILENFPRFVTFEEKDKSVKLKSNEQINLEYKEYLSKKKKPAIKKEKEKEPVVETKQEIKEVTKQEPKQEIKEEPKKELLEEKKEKPKRGRPKKN